MKKTLLIFLIAYFITSCKKQRNCVCKGNNGRENFSKEINATKRNAKVICEQQHAYWSPEWSCSLE